MDVVIQAVGRVRPYTRPREVVTFQCASHPQLAYTAEFSSLAQAREYFELPTRKGAAKAARVNQVQEARQAGLTQHEAAAQTGHSLSTVKRHWNRAQVS
jgi:DNA-binding NarL/FixJ family response regulator